MFFCLTKGGTGINPEVKMDLSYEETMIRIKQLEKMYSICKKKKYPLNVAVFRGENQILVVPKITTIGSFSTYMAWHIVIKDIGSADIIGKAVMDAFEHIRVSPVDARTEKECKDDFFYLKSTKCRSYRAFNKKYLLCGVHKYEQGNYIVSATERIGNNEGYGGLETNDIFLPDTATAEDIGKAVIDTLEISEKYDTSKKSDVSTVDIELLNGDKIKTFPPQSRCFTDCDDGGAAEIHKLYEYSQKDSTASFARFFIGIAAELNCNTNEDNIRIVWERLYGNAEGFEVKSANCGIFTIRADMRNKNIRKISYLRCIDENELLECSMEIDSPNKRKKTEEKLLNMFEEFASKCKFKE